MSRNESLIWVAGTALGAAVLGLSGLAVPGMRQAPQARTVDAAQALICPSMPADRGTARAAWWSERGSVEVVDVAASAVAHPVTPGTVQIVEKPQVSLVTFREGSRAGAGVVTAETTGLERGIAASGCEMPRTSAWLVGLVNGKDLTSEVVLTNPDDVTATVDLTLHGPSGRIAAAGSRSVDVKPHASVKVALSQLVGATTEPVAVHVAATQGRVGAVARMLRYSQGAADGSGVDWVAQAAAPREDVVLAAVPGGAGRRQLVVTNPGLRSAEVHLSVLTEAGPVTLPTLESVSVGPQATAVFDAEALLGGKTVGLHLHADVPVVAALSAVAGEAGDLAVVGAARTFTGVATLPLAVKDLTATLVVANPTEAPAAATLVVRGQNGAELARQQVELAANSSRGVALPAAEAIVVDLEVTRGELAGDVVLTGDRGIAGLAVVPLRGPAPAPDAVEPVRDPGYGSSR